MSKELGEMERVETIIRIHDLRKIYDFNKRKMNKKNHWLNKYDIAHDTSIKYGLL